MAIKVGDVVVRLEMWCCYEKGYTFQVARVDPFKETVREINLSFDHMLTSVRRATYAERVAFFNQSKQGKRLVLKLDSKSQQLNTGDGDMMRKKTDGRTKWSFKANGVSDIDFENIAQDLTRKNPIALVTGVDGYRVAVVSSLLESKLRYCEEGHQINKVILENSTRSVTFYNGGSLYVINNQESTAAFVEAWKQVRKARIQERYRFDTNATIEVALLKI